MSEYEAVNNPSKTIDDYIFDKPYSSASDEIYADAAKELLQPYPSSPIKSFPKFSKLTGGFRSYEFTILCGATGTGKTTLIANFSDSLIEQKIPHFVASVETGSTDFLKRVISCRYNKDINRGDPISVEEMKRIHELYGHLYRSNPCLFLSLYDNRCKVEKLMNDIAWHVKHKGIKVAMIDNINFFMEVTSSENAIVEMDRVLHELIIFCKRVEVHLIMVMHPKKTSSGRVESEFDIKGSSTAVQEAHNVLLFNRPPSEMIKDNLATKYDRELKVAKMRRRGMAVGNRLMFTSQNGVKYNEGDLYEF